jgi:NAD(P)-dependent dehydrogenase (short-subunit alcohol dehydrogenase family)
MREFEGKVAVITGAASGIGWGIAERLAAEGMKVVLSDIDQQGLDVAVQKLRQQERDVIGVLTNVADAASVDQLAAEALSAYGKVHLVCNNAGVAGGGAVPIWETTPKDWQWVFGVNFWGVLNGVRTFLPLLLDQGEEGHVVNTGSIAGLVNGNGIYGVSKHAVVALSESMFSQLKLREAKVGVSVLCPGFVSTRIYEADRNRPAELQNENAAPVDPEARRAMSRVVTEGTPPSEVAEKVFEGIREERLYIITHDNFDEAIRSRFENVLGRKNPVPRAPVR